MLETVHLHGRLRSLPELCCHRLKLCVFEGAVCSKLIVITQW